MVAKMERKKKTGDFSGKTGNISKTLRCMA